MALPLSKQRRFLLLTARPPQLYPLFHLDFLRLLPYFHALQQRHRQYSIFKTGRNFVRIDALDPNGDLGRWSIALTLRS
jgi:hypothetical protein